MECDNTLKNGCISATHTRGSRVGYELEVGSTHALQLDPPAVLPGAAAADAAVTMVPSHAPHLVVNARRNSQPFMNTMDEITYWVFTKRAPCLMNYDNTIKKQNEEPHTSKIKKPKSVPSAVEVPSSKKKKKRKLSLLDNDSGCDEKQQNVFFDTSHTKKHNVMSSCKSDVLRSEIDFNIKMPSVKGKQAQSKIKKSSRTTLHKKNKLVTSTPKAPQLRRSLRQAQQVVNNNCQLNSSFLVYNASVINGDNKTHKILEKMSLYKTKKSTELLAGGDQSADNKVDTNVNKLNPSKNELLNGQFEDLSDVSGFTANYIRSTKLQSTKSTRKLRCMNDRNLMKEPQACVQKDSTLLVCLNKSMNTEPKTGGHDCSTESMNVLNLVTTNSNLKSTRVNKSTSLLKFMDLKTSNESSNNRSAVRTKAKVIKNVSFQSSSNTSRYPKRHRNNSITHDKQTEEPPKKVVQPDKCLKICKKSSEFTNSDKKENPEDSSVSRTRSGKNIGLSLRQPENSVLVLSTCTDQASSMASMNVASATGNAREQKKKRHTRRHQSKKLDDKHESMQRDSLRDKSGFTACFSESDEDGETLQRKYFCA